MLRYVYYVWAFDVSGRATPAGVWGTDLKKLCWHFISMHTRNRFSPNGKPIHSIRYEKRESDSPNSKILEKGKLTHCEMKAICLDSHKKLRPRKNGRAFLNNAVASASRPIQKKEKKSVLPGGKKTKAVKS